MKYKIICFIILINFINNITEENLLRKNKGIKTNKNYVIFDSSSFSSGKTMDFILKSKYYCDNEIKYAYFNNLNDIQINPSIPYSVNSSKEEKSIKKNKIISKTKYFTIKKNEDEFNDSEGDYLLLYFGCAGEVEIKNGKKIIKDYVIAIIVLTSIIVLLLTGWLAYYYFVIKKNNKGNNNEKVAHINVNKKVVS